MRSNGDVFKVKGILRNRFSPGLFSLIELPVEHLLSLPQLNRMYAEISGDGDGRPFLEKVIEVLNIRFDVGAADLGRIPGRGPVIVVSNHPFGGIEGIILAHILRSVRHDVKFLANHLLGRISETRDLFILVDPYGEKSSTARNIGPVKEAIRWVKGGGMLGIFPAGDVSRLQIASRTVADPEWSEAVARIVRKAGASVLPVYFEGGNSLVFHVLGLFHPMVRTVLLPRELLNKRGRAIEVKVGNPIGFTKLNSFATNHDMISHLRLRTYALKNRRRTGSSCAPNIFSREHRRRRSTPLVSPRPGSLLVEEVLSLQPEQTLLKSGEYIVLHAAGRRMRNLLHEIGRLREVTFREAGEGTGRSIDLDRFDQYYTHLFLWNREKGELVGAYRIGKTDEIVREFGIKGLYTSTLFHYKKQLLEQIDPALELGRSFVRPEYQKSYSPLLLLWRGIGRFICRNPRYRFLFGPVSISDGYHSFSRQLMTTFLRLNNHLPEFARYVKARRPLRERAVACIEAGITKGALGDVEDLMAIVSDVEDDRSGIPILLRQYLKLGAKLLEFNIDPKFSDVVDALMMVDLTRTEPGMLERYMGKEGTSTFLAYHRCSQVGEAEARIA